MGRCLLLCLLVLLVVVPAPRVAHADPPARGSAVTLPELPALPPIERPDPKPQAVQSLDERLEQLGSLRVTHPVEPRIDFGFLTADLDGDIVPAIAQRLELLRRSLDGRGARTLLSRAREQGTRALPRAKNKQSHGDEGDWLQFVLALCKHDSAASCDLAQIYAMLRMLEAVGSTPAAREMIHSYGYFGELVRIDLQRAIERLKDTSVPALIEAREHDAKKVRDWARRRLESIGRAIASEAVATPDAEVLAGVLLAFGRVRDVDAARVVLSYAASERVQLRNAARASLVAMGEPAMWHVKDAYENLTGDKPERGWDFKRLLQELFRLHDRARSSAVIELMERGSAAAATGDVRGAVGYFDQLLGRAPLFEKRREMAPAYVAYARALDKAGKSDEALLALRKALRLDPDGADRASIESRAAYLEGKTLAERGTADPFILRRALELDPSNDEARALLLRLEARPTAPKERTRRHAAAIAVGMAALLAMVWLARRR